MFLRPKKIKERISLLPFPGFRSKLTLQNENYHIETPERELFVETNWQPTEFFDRKIPFPSSISSPNPCQRRESVRDPWRVDFETTALLPGQRRNDRWARDAAAARGAARPWNAKLNGASRPKYEIPRPCHTHTRARDTYLYCRRATIHEPWRKRVYLFLCDARRAQKGHNGPQIGVHNEVSREGSGAGEVDTTGRGGDASAPLCCLGALPETINPR